MLFHAKIHKRESYLWNFKDTVEQLCSLALYFPICWISDCDFPFNNFLSWKVSRFRISSFCVHHWMLLMPTGFTAALTVHQLSHNRNKAGKISQVFFSMNGLQTCGDFQKLSFKHGLERKLEPRNINWWTFYSCF